MIIQGKNFGIESFGVYEDLQTKAEKIKLSLLDLIAKEKFAVAGYGAAAKANALLNFSGIKNDLIDMVADKAKSKQGLFMPGSHIPIVSPKILADNINDYVIFMELI